MPCRVDSWLEENLGPFLIGKIAALTQFPEHVVRAVATVILQHLSAGLAGLGGARQVIDATIARVFAGERTPRVLLTSGVYGPVGRQLHEACREPDRTLIDFENLVDVLEAVDAFVRAGWWGEQAEMAAGGADEDVADERTFAGAGDAGDAGPAGEGERGRDVFEVVMAGVVDFNLSSSFGFN